MNLDWLSWTNPVSFWWVFLSSLSILNILFWLWTRYYLNKEHYFDSAITRKIVYLSAVYVFVCALRSILPKADVQRICLFDSWFSSVFFGRTIATIAELSFIAQWYLIIFNIGKSVQSKLAQYLSHMFLVLIIAAECFSWFAVVTTNYIGNTIEESLWGVTYSLIFLSLLAIIPKLKGPLQYSAIAALAGCLSYVYFMFTVDVPMYLHRWLQDSVNAKKYFSLADGIIDLNTRWVVTHDIMIWKEEIPWMTLYFTFAVWVSIALCYIPLSEKYLMPYKNLND